MGNMYGNQGLDDRPVHLSLDEDINMECGTIGADVNYSNVITDVTCTRCKRTKRYKALRKAQSCPWCGSLVWDEESQLDKYYLICLNCGASGPTGGSYEEANELFADRYEI